MSKFVRSLTIAAAALMLGGQALAQDVPPPPPPPTGQASALPTPAEQSDRLRQTLRLRPDQETALQAFVAAMQSRPGEADALRAEAQREAGLPTPQRLDALVARLDRMRAEIMAKITATRAFYAHLSPEQQRAFDAMPSVGR
jgi:periplasmic protein CpxP/Spy